MNKIRFKDILWMPFPLSCELCRMPTSMAMPRPVAFQMRCRDHLLPSIHGRDIPKLERWLQALDQTKLTIKTEESLSPKIMGEQARELRNAYTWHWLHNARREADATSYKEFPKVRERFDEQTRLSVTSPLPEPGGEPTGICIVFDAPVSLVHYWTKQDLLEEIRRNRWWITQHTAESEQPGNQQRKDWSAVDRNRPIKASCWLEGNARGETSSSGRVQGP